VLANRTQALALAFLATVFIAGGAVGWGLRNWALTKRPPSVRNARALVAYLTRQLVLSQAQQDSVRAVLEGHRAEADSIWRATRPRFDSLRQTIQAEIDEQLTTTQQLRFHALMNRQGRGRRAADSVSQEQLWDPDRDRVPAWLDRCPDTPPGALVDSSGCATRRAGRNGIK
jgi:Heavy-metal resistance